MKREESMSLLKCIGNATVEKLPEILEPYSKYLKSVGILIQALKDGVDNYKKESLCNDVRDEIIQKAEQEPQPKYMSCVIFSGKTLREEEKESLAEIFQQEYESQDTNSLNVVSHFIEEYMGNNIEPDSEDDMELGASYIGFDFFCEDFDGGLLYNSDDMDKLMNAMNNLLGRQVFEKYIIGGYDRDDEVE